MGSQRALVADMKLYQLEWCPSCTSVRHALAKLGMSYEIVNVPKLGSDRSAVLALPGVDGPAVPVLTDGDTLLQGSDRIIEYVTEKAGAPGFGDPGYALTRTFPGMSYDDAISAATTALAAEGFGILTEIDVKKTLKKKIDVDFTPYIILGACNPKLAHQALSAEPGVGVLLPCNVVVTEDADKNAVVSAIDPVKLFSVVDRADIEPLAQDVRTRLVRVLEAMG